MTQCTAITRKGKRCSRQAAAPSRLCKQHQQIHAKKETLSSFPSEDDFSPPAKNENQTREKHRNWWPEATAQDVAVFTIGALIGLVIIIFIADQVVMKLAREADNISFQSSTLLQREKSRLFLELLNFMQWTKANKPEEQEAVEKSIETIEQYLADYSSAYQSERQVIENRYNVDRILGRQPTPAPQFSMERDILLLRSEVFNNPYATTHLYLFLPTGRIAKIRMRGRLVSLTKGLLPVDSTAGNFLPDEKGLFGDDGQAWVGITEQGGLIEIGSRVPFLLSENELDFGDEESVQSVREYGADQGDWLYLPSEADQPNSSIPAPAASEPPLPPPEPQTPHKPTTPP